MDAIRTITTGFLGLGNIGAGVWRLLDEMGEEIAAREGVRFRVKKALVRDTLKRRDVSAPPSVLTASADDVLDDPDIELVVEALGGEQPAAEYIRRALTSGKSVVTANKLALATHWQELLETARATGSCLYFEPGVCGAIPVIRTITDSLQANRVERLYGIINGTTNYILSKMSAPFAGQGSASGATGSRGVSYADALYEAQRLGLAEPDPTADVEGGDAACKLSILSTLAFRAHVPLEGLFRRGITTITPVDVAYGRELGYALKLLAVAKRDGDRVQARVHPTFVPLSHPLASVNGSLNAVYLYGHACGELMLYGRGAGDAPTASAVVSDMIAAVREGCVGGGDAYRMTGKVVMETDWESRYFIRMLAVDRPGVLGAIAGILGRHGVSIASLRQTVGNGRAPLLFVTHIARESDVRAALSEIDESLAAIENVIYVEEGL
ncbi:MAG: homoserine dehydrogenase [Oscillospiraceae bacterium]|jgi:homoserine dehydrogenase|nr:homoserine dehydrogenase [Oscillospiraceae bacterium]